MREACAGIGRAMRYSWRMASGVSGIRLSALFVLLLLVAPLARAEQVLLVFGDSLSAAYGISASQGWVALLGERVARAKLPWRVVNASVSGETTSGGLRRLPEDLRRHKPDVVLIALGPNDALRGQPLAATRANLERLIADCRRAKAEPVLIGFMIPPNYGIDYAREFHEMYLQLAKRNKLPLVPFLLEGIADRRELFQADQLHPVAAAQPRILDNVWPVVEPVLKKRVPAPS
jgi:acyl-CoA thioesterase I